MQIAADLRAALHWRAQGQATHFGQESDWRLLQRSVSPVFFSRHVLPAPQPIMPIISSNAKKIVSTIEIATNNRNKRSQAPNRDNLYAWRSCL
jgi:hypothetical protein